jgi:hypothetical protein
VPPIGGDVSNAKVAEELRDAWKQVEALRWHDDLSGWSVELGETSDRASGRCTPEEKLVTIRPGQGGNGLLVSLIHEVCHALVGAGHGPAWKARMREAIERTQAVNEGLSNALAWDLEEYEFVRKNTVLSVRDYLRRAAESLSYQYGVDRSVALAEFPKLAALLEAVTSEAEDLCKKHDIDDATSDWRELPEEYYR